MPRIPDLPADAAPDPSDKVLMFDASADTTEAATFDNVAASSAFSGRYQPIDDDLTTLAGGSLPSNLNAMLDALYQPVDADLTTLAGGALPSNIQSVTDARYRTPSLAPMARVAKIADGDIFRVALIGMSISSFGRSLPMLGERIRSAYGVGAAQPQSAVALGGSFSDAVAGWKKQAHGGPRFGRIRGDATSTGNLPLSMYGDTLTFWFSRETDSEACNILVDGEVVGTTPAAGAQAYMLKQTFNVTLGAHEVEIVKPSGGGYCYFEQYEAYDSTNPGVVVHDWTLGGTSWRNTKVLRTAGGEMVAGVAIQGNNGIDSHFDNDDFDLYLFNHDVNDAGGGSAVIASDFVPSLARAVELTRTRVVPLVLISSMAGHYAWEANGSDKFAAFNAIRELFIATAAAESHVTHIDWHGATVLDDIEKYAATYYTGVSVNAGAGTYTGDFIHPTTSQAYLAFESVCSQPFGLPPAMGRNSGEESATRNSPPPTSVQTTPVARKTWHLVSTSCTFNGSTDTFTTPSAHGLAVGDKVLFRTLLSNGNAEGFTGAPGWVHSVPTSTTFTISYSDGGEQFVSSSTFTLYNANQIVKEVERQYAGPAEMGFLPLWANGPNIHRREGFAEVPVFFERESTAVDELGTGFSGVRATIAASGTSDDFGAYKFYDSATANFTVPRGYHTFGATAYCLVKYAGDFQVRLGINGASGGVIWFVDESGDPMETPYATERDIISFPSVTYGDQPRTAIVPVRGGASTTTAVNVSVGPNGVRIYDYALVPAPVWPPHYQ